MIFSLNQILLVSIITNQENSVSIGKPFLDASYAIEATVIRHLSGPKIRVYKMIKKKTRKTFVSRRKLTRVLINSISKK